MRALFRWIPLTIGSLLWAACGDNDALLEDAAAISSSDAAISTSRVDAAVEDDRDGAPAAAAEADASDAAQAAETGALDAAAGAADGEAGQDAQANAPLDATSSDADAVDASASEGALDAELADGNSADAASEPDAGELGEPDGSEPDGGEPELCGRINCDCTFEGTPLWGKVEVVESFGMGDFKIREAPFADLKVLETALPRRCGEWTFVDALGYPDFTVEFVANGEDFTIEYATFPGVGRPQ